MDKAERAEAGRIILAWGAAADWPALPIKWNVRVSPPVPYLTLMAGERAWRAFAVAANAADIRAALLATDMAGIVPAEDPHTRLPGEAEATGPLFYVDQIIRWPQTPAPGAERYFGNGKPSCHLMTTGTVADLVKFAAKIGLRREWLQDGAARPGDLPHFDLTPSKRVLAVKAGAIQADGKVVIPELMRRIREAHATAHEAVAV